MVNEEELRARLLDITTRACKSLLEEVPEETPTHDEYAEAAFVTIWPDIAALLDDIKLYEELRLAVEKYIKANALTSEKADAWAEVGNILHYLHYKLDKTAAEFEDMYPKGERRPVIYSGRS